MAKVAPEFARIVDKIGPDKTFRVLLAYYPNGALLCDTEQPYFPRADGSFYKITAPTAPPEVVKHLGYGKGGAPLAMVLDKQIEFLVDLKSEKKTIPWLICSAGDLYPLSTILNEKNERIYTPVSLLTTAAAVRSVFTLPSIGSAENFMHLQRDFNIKSPVPKQLYHHHQIFKEIINSEAANCDWRCVMLFFFEQWITHINEDPAWMELNLYLHKLAWKRYKFDRNRIYLDITASIIQKDENLKPNPYVVDTAKHLLAMALGDVPGYVPACNNDGCPNDFLQGVLVDSYRLKKYLPTIMQPAHFRFEHDTLPAYYSSQYPSTLVFSPKSRQTCSTVVEMRDLEYITSSFLTALSNVFSCVMLFIKYISKNLHAINKELPGVKQVMNFAALRRFYLGLNLS